MEPPRFPLWTSIQALHSPSCCSIQAVFEEKRSTGSMRRRGKLLFHHHRSATAWLIAIKEKGQRHHQDRSKAKHIINVHISQGLGLRLKLVVHLPLGQV